MPLAPYALYAGAQGLIWGGAAIAPKTCVKLVELIGRGEWAAAREPWRLLEPVMSLIWEGDYAQSVYAAAELTGYGAGHPRRPLSRLTPHKLARLEAALGSLVEHEA